MEERRTAAGRPDRFSYGVSGYVIVRDSEAEAQEELARILDVRSSPEAYASYQDFVAGSQLESQVSLRSTPSRTAALRAGWSGTPAQVTERLRAYERPAWTSCCCSSRRSAGDGALRATVIAGTTGL
jgi:FMNH2-dependent dimethyl sulfone monooxygenase